MTRARWGITRPQLLMISLMALFLVVIAYLQAQPDAVQAYDPADTSSSGLRALVLWLEELGHPVTETMSRTGVPATAELLFIYTNEGSLPAYGSEVAARADATATYAWVRRGGTLVLVGPAAPYLALEEHFGVAQVESLTGMVAGSRQVQPLLPDLPTRWDSFYAPRTLETAAGRAIVPVLVQSTGAPVIALQHIGDGVVWHLTEDFAFTNLNLRDARIAALLPAILRTIPAGAPVVISTPHLTTFDALVDELGEVTTLQDWLYATPFGQATLLLLVALFLYLLLQGRRLGPALAAPTATRPREAAEYVSALAGLQRRMRQPQTVAAHHRQRLKHAIGRLAQTPADLPDAEWLAHVQRADALPAATIHAITDLLTRYARVERGTDDEADLIHTVQATDALLATLPRANKQLVR